MKAIDEQFLVEGVWDSRNTQPCAVDLRSVCTFCKTIVEMYIRQQQHTDQEADSELLVLFFSGQLHNFFSALESYAVAAQRAIDHRNEQNGKDQEVVG